MKSTALTIISGMALAFTCMTVHCAHAQSATSGKSYAAPDFMDGDKTGSSDGNPVEAMGKPMWRLDQIWPDDPLNHDNYKPLIWAGDHWDGAYDFGGQPAGTVEAGTITLGVRGSWGGGGTMPGNKLAAIVFIAPSKGHYTLSGTARAGVWQGDGTAFTLSVFKYDPAQNTVKRLTSVALPKDTDVALDGTAADLESGQELIIAPLVGAMYTAANVVFTGLNVHGGTGAAGSGGNSAAQGGPTTNPKVGDLLAVNGHNYKVESVTGKVITIRLQD